MEELPVISVFGLPGSGRHSLVSSLLRDSGDIGACATVSGLVGAPWRISTKYYTADVAFRVQDCSSSPASASGPTFDGEAIVLVFDATDEGSFAAIRNWASSHGESTEEAGVRLVVATHADRIAGASVPPAPATSQEQKSHLGNEDRQRNCVLSSCASRPQWLVDAMDWCAGECYEYVECSTTDSLVDQQLRLEGDVQGIARIKEALQARP